MKILMTIFFVCIFLICVFGITTQKQSIRRIQVNVSLPISNAKGQVEAMKDSFNIFKAIIYYIFCRLLIQKFTTQKKDTSKKITEQYHYFGFAQGDSLGLMYETMQSKKYEKLSVDSVLAGQGLGTISKAELLSYNQRFVKTTTQTKGVFQTIYCSDKIEDINTPDSIYFTFSEHLKWIKISISNRMDSLNQSKLSKLLILYKAQFYKGYENKIPERKFIIEMREMPVDNLKGISAFFKRLKNEL